MMNKLLISVLMLLMVGCSGERAQSGGEPIPRAMSSPAAAPAFQVWTESGLVKVLKTSAPTGTATISLKAARNEFEMAHLVVRANGSALAQVDVQVSDLENGQARIPSKFIRVYLERYLRVEKRSNAEGAAGDWPDALIPKEDIFYGEKRNAFPFSVAVGENQPVLIEVYVPEKAKAGVYRGYIEVTAQGQSPVNVPVEIEVFDFALPSTSSLQTSYSMSMFGISRGFTKGLKYNEPGLVSLVLKDMLLHRISVRAATWQSHAPYKKRSGSLDVDWTSWDRYFADFFEGRALDDMHVLPGARFTTWNLLVDTVPVGDQIAYADEQVEHFRKKGWKQFLYRKIADEPEKKQYAQVHAELQKWMRMKSRVPLMVTTGDVREFAGEVTLWCNVMNFVHRYDDKSDRGHRDGAFAARKAAGEHLWWYQACNSTGCFIDGTPPIHTGWPNVAIDFQGIYQRIMPWMTWKYDVGGELYYDVAANWYIWDGKDGSKNDPWLNFDHFRLNGDGRLIYPGTVEKIGGTHPIPIESLRLKLLRDGYEDYEYFVLMKKMGLDTELNAMISQLIKRNNDWKKDPKLLAELRNRMGALISQKNSAVGSRGK